jgi:hypothetical protein
MHAEYASLLRPGRYPTWPPKFKSRQKQSNSKTPSLVLHTDLQVSLVRKRINVGATT